MAVPSIFFNLKTIYFLPKPGKMASNIAFNWLLILWLQLATLCNGTSEQGIIYSSSFEREIELQQWTTEKCRPGAITIKSMKARTGCNAVRFELKRKDAVDYNKYVRAELKQKFASDETGEMWYGFSNFLPGDYFADPVPEVIAQWHGRPDWDMGEDWRSPPVSLELRNGHYVVKVMWASKAVNTNRTKDGEMYYDLGEVNLNEWVDWVFHIRYRFENDGLLEVWKNKELVLTRKGPNSYNDEYYPYFKLGIYKWAWANDHIISPITQRVLYFDAVKIGNRSADLQTVSPEIDHTDCEHS